MQAFDIDPNYGGRAVESGSFQLWPWKPPEVRRGARGILREWRGRVPAALTREYAEYMRSTGIRDYAATPGHLGTWLLADRGPWETEFVFLTQWESPEAIRAFAGDDIGRARYYPEDRDYLLELPERVRHYELVVQSEDAR